MTTPEPNSGPQLLPPDKFQPALIGGAVVFGLVLVIFGFGESMTLPKKPPRPKVTVQAAADYSQKLSRNQGAYEAFLQKDAMTYGARPTSLEEMSGVFPHRVDASEHRLTIGRKGNPTVETAGLRLTLGVRERRRGKETMILQIENLLDRPVAYRVETRPSRSRSSCARKEELLHNAIALAVDDVEVRSECAYRKGTKLTVTRVETVELPELGYYYLSRVYPVNLGLSRRTTRSHKPPVGQRCNLLLPAGVQRGIETGAVSWRDLVDFYARHRCDSYTFSSGYRAFTRQGERPLPAVNPAR